MAASSCSESEFSQAFFAIAGVYPVLRDSCTRPGARSPARATPSNAAIRASPRSTSSVIHRSALHDSKKIPKKQGASGSRTETEPVANRREFSVPAGSRLLAAFVKVLS
jgi:hypothetical protein